MDIGFIKIRRGILEHLLNGWVSYEEYSLYLHLIILADHKTGVVWKICSEFLSKQTGQHRHTINRILKRLENGANYPGQIQYIKRLRKENSRFPYPILINKYELKNGSRLVSEKSLSIKELHYERVSDALSDALSDPLSDPIHKNKKKRKKEVNKHNDEIFDNFFNGGNSETGFF